jgi:hypothetical protein
VDESVRFEERGIEALDALLALRMDSATALDSALVGRPLDRAAVVTDDDGLQQLGRLRANRPRAVAVAREGALDWLPRAHGANFS